MLDHTGNKIPVQARIIDRIIRRCRGKQVKLVGEEEDKDQCDEIVGDVRKTDANVCDPFRSLLLASPTNQSSQDEAKYPGDNGRKSQQTNRPGQGASDKYLRGIGEVEERRPQVVLDNELVHIVNILLKEIAIEAKNCVVVFDKVLTCGGVIDLFCLKALDISLDRIAWYESKEKEGDGEGTPESEQVHEKAANGI